MLIAEYAVVSYRFDAQVLLRSSGVWSVLGWSGNVVPVALAVGAAALVFSRTSSSSEPAPARVPLSRTLALVAAHVLSLAAFFALTARIFGPDGPPSVWPAAWLGAWVAAGAATAGSLVLAAMAPSGRTLARWFLGLVMGGGVIGVAAFGLAEAALGLWPLLGGVTLRAVRWVLGMWFDDVFSNPALAEIGTERFVVNVDVTCSGFEGMGLIAAFACGLLWIDRKRLRFPGALLLVPLGVLLSFGFNVLRIAGLVAVGTLISEDVALGGFHSKVGWLMFTALSLGMVVGVRALSRRGPAPAPTLRFGSAEAHLVPLLCMVAVALATGAFAAEIDWLYGLRILAGGAAVLAFRRSYKLARPTGVASAGVGLAVLALWLAVEPSSAQQRTEHIASALSRVPAPAAWAWLAVKALGSSTVVPLVEELAFRGYLLRRLSTREDILPALGQTSWFALALSSILFGLLHASWLGGVIAGFSYGWLARRTGSLSSAVVAHATTNAGLSCFVLLSRAYGYWG